MRLHLALTLCLALAACASRAPEPPAEVRACMPERRLIGGEYAKKLARLTQRANAFSACMQAKGYTLDETALDDALLRHEYKLNADPMYGDPQQALDIRKQELLVDPLFWRKGGQATPPASS